MTEAEWLACDDPEQLLKALVWRTQDRKMLLFACACCRRIWPLLVDAGCRTAVEATERAIERQGNSDEVRQTAAAATAVADAVDERFTRPDAHFYAASAVADTVSPFGSPSKMQVSSCVASAAAYRAGAADVARYDEVYAVTEREELAAHACLLREVFGNPFRPVIFSREWRTDTAVALARQMYESRDFSAMPILADAIQDAGCENADILDHCRSDGPHVRGCWAVDLVIGKE